MGFNKKILSKAVSELGKAKAPAKPRDITVDPKGYWNPANQGKPVRIPGNGDPKGVPITMGSDPETGEPVPFPVWAQPNVGPGIAMQQGQDYYFPDADYVDETPMAKKGGTAGKLSNDNGLVTKVVPMKFDLPELKGAEKINDKVTLAMSPNSTGLYKIGKDIEKFCGIPEADVIRDVKAGKDKPEDAIIYGMSNIMNGGKDIYLWINGTRLQGAAKKKGIDKAIMEIVSHESLHITRKLLTRAIAKSKGISIDNEDWVKHNYGDGEYMWPAVGDVSEKHPIVQIDEEAFATAEGYVTERILPHFLEMAKKYLDINKDKVFKKGGTLQSKKYSSSISATNKLFAKNKLFKNMKSKIFDPNSKFKSGGSKLGSINLDPNPLSHYELNYGFNLPTKQEGGPQYTFPERDLYPEEDEYFSQNPHVGGMAAEDNHIIINPYSKLTDQEKDAIRQNEGARLAMRNGHPRPTFNLTDEQKESFKNYSQDEQDQRETIIGRIISGDPSVGKVSPEQQAYADQLSKLLKPGVNLKNTSGPRNNIIDDGEELELTDEEIQAYRDGGYVVEELPEHEIGGYVQHELVKAQTGLETEPQVAEEDKYATTVMDPVEVKGEKAEWSKLQEQYEKNTPYEEYFHKRKQKYLKSRPKNLTKLMGIGDDDIPESVANSIYNDYQYRKNNYITKNLGPKKGFNPRKHGEWVDNLSKKEREIISNSRYGKNLQPSLWTRTGAGAQELANFLVKSSGIPALMGDPDKDVLNYKNKGLTNKEYKDIHDSGTGALNTFAAGDIPGAIIANALTNSNREQPGLLSGQLMGNVTPDRAAGLNPLMLTGAGEMMAGKSLLGLGVDALRPGLKNIGNLSKYIPESIPGTTTTGGGNLNAGISPELIQNFVGPKNKVLANVLDKTYLPWLNKAANKINPLNWIPGYGNKLEGAVRPLGNTIGDVIEGGNLITPKSTFSKIKNKIKPTTNEAGKTITETSPIQFTGPPQRGGHEVISSLGDLRTSGKNWDKTGLSSNDLLRDDMLQYHGTFDGRPVVEVKMPDGTSQHFYKSTGAAGKSARNAATTEGMWQPFGGYAPNGNTKNWFIKDGTELTYDGVKYKPKTVTIDGKSKTLTAYDQLADPAYNHTGRPLNGYDLVDQGKASVDKHGYESYYGSKTFQDMAENMDQALMRKTGTKSNEELNNAFNFNNRYGNVDSYTPGQKIAPNTTTRVVKPEVTKPITTKFGKTNAADIYSAHFDPDVAGSNIKFGEANKQGVLGRTFRKSHAEYPIQNKAGENLDNVPLTDPGVSLKRRKPFSNRYVDVNKQKLLNNEFQWSTTGAGLQRLGEKFGTAAGLGVVGGLGTAGAAAYNYNPLDYYSAADRKYLETENTPLDELRPNTTRSDVFLKELGKNLISPIDYIKKSADPYMLRTIGDEIYGDKKSDEYKQGGAIEEVWEDELDEHTIALLRKAGYTVEELD